MSVVVSQERNLPLHLAPAIIVSVGGALVFAAMFMPNTATADLSLIRENMVIQNSPVLILCSLAALIAAIRYWSVGSKSSANAAIYAGIWFFGWTIYDAYSAQLVRDGVNIETDAGAGLWTAGVGCLIVALGGLMMRYPHLSFGLASGAVLPRDEASSKFDRKTCPKCAETIKAAALVCRFCHHEFKT